jgi:hypothetical protein
MSVEDGSFRASTTPMPTEQSEMLTTEYRLETGGSSYQTSEVDGAFDTGFTVKSARVDSVEADQPECNGLESSLSFDGMNCSPDQ